MNEFSLRPAVEQDQPTIRRLVMEARINPMGLDWHRFWLAEAEGEVIGCCQIKPHRDGSRELASLVVGDDWRGKGVARAMIEHFLAVEDRPLYLMCRSELESFYEKFGFRSLDIDEMPKYFRRISRLMNTAAVFGGSDMNPLIMGLER